MKQRATPTDRLVTAALEAAATQPWGTLTLKALAQKAGVPLAEASVLFPSLNDLLPATLAATDVRVAAGGADYGAEESLHDRLFDLLMRRFDVLQENRAALLSIHDACVQDPRLAARMLKTQQKAMQKTLLLAGFTATPVRLKIAATALLLAYGATLYVWFTDETPDMSKTLARLDQSLSKIRAVLASSLHTR